ncbi:hypothetical protein [Desulfurobacterium sp.]
MIEAYLLKLVVVFIIIVVSLAVVYYSVGRYSIVKPGHSGSIKIIEVKYISKNRGFILMDIEDSKILLSFDETGFKKLKEWSNEENSNI